MFELWQKRLFPNFWQGVLSTFVVGLILYWLGHFLLWFLIDATWFGTAADCRQAEGACLSFYWHQWRFILFGPYPAAEQWRPTIFIAGLIASVFYARKLNRWNRNYFIYLFAFMIFSLFLLRGGLFGLSFVPVHKWGGLPLTLLLAFVGNIIAFPYGIMLALGRRSKKTLIKSLCVAHIELIRGVPLISLLFMASVMFPLLLPQSWSFPKLLRAQIAVILFCGAYQAEVIRGGLQSIDKGQYEAADSLGLGYWQKMGLIILPQALRIVIPPAMNTALGMLKDTSLVIIIALFDLMATTKASVQDGDWLGFSLEAYIFAAMIYFSLCGALAYLSRGWERQLQREKVL